LSILKKQRGCPTHKENGICIFTCPKFISLSVQSYLLLGSNTKIPFIKQVEIKRKLSFFSNNKKMRLA
jgi:hypothetical protein